MAHVVEVQRKHAAGAPSIVIGRPTNGRIRCAQVMLGLLIVGAVSVVAVEAWLVNARVAAKHACSERLRELGAAFQAYHAQHDRFPAAAIVDVQGRPLLSWRVELLPYLGQQALYDRFHRGEPWNSPHNLSLLSKMPRVFACPAEPRALRGATTFRVVVGPKAGLGVVGTMFEQARGIDIREVTDGTSNTLMVAEAPGPVPWTKPDELSLPDGTAIPTFGSGHIGGFHVLLADGSVRFLRPTVAPTTLRTLLTRDGGEVVSA